ncbi:ABC transporter ATP-binding protein [Dissulfurirhabdus thermomarina]|uniref:ABC transporter ATP-binding protein n=1 Tax=Dissulfurirhabdus thermomarina TaxID=1765737 RepID=A0A6N9TK71_DISTH|nr:ABC transporter ATP-binding protein [Dissulfurirhabdus thermomarina]NDY41661.1 ABC transporter ATP-binding protein [Dissulfurirhabdus thermomarina]NMX24353.1 ABC transporter ATP-binding protein [Dissulfurirhabdus thermomarina]
MIEARGLVKRYGGIRALEGVSFSVRRGEIFGLLGPNGAGKSTTLRILTLLTRPDAGRALLGGRDVRADPAAAKRRFGVVPQEINLDKDLDAEENLRIYAMLHGVADREAKVEAALARAGLRERRRQRVGELSGGLQRRLLIARALLPAPEVLFLDEPTVGLDPQIRREIWDEIRAARQAGCTLLLTTHYIEEAEALCGRVGILDRGRLIALDTPAALKRRIGSHVVEVTGADGRTRRRPCRDEAEARRAAAGAGGISVTIRPANLEDVFVELTGKRIAA